MFLVIFWAKRFAVSGFSHERIWGCSSSSVTPWFFIFLVFLDKMINWLIRNIINSVSPHLMFKQCPHCETQSFFCHLQFIFRKGVWAHFGLNTSIIQIAIQSQPITYRLTLKLTDQHTLHKTSTSQSTVCFISNVLRPHSVLDNNGFSWQQQRGCSLPLETKQHTPPPTPEYTLWILEKTFHQSCCSVN